MIAPPVSVHGSSLATSAGSSGGAAEGDQPSTQPLGHRSRRPSGHCLSTRWVARPRLDLCVRGGAVAVTFAVASPPPLPVPPLPHPPAWPDVLSAGALLEGGRRRALHNDPRLPVANRPRPLDGGHAPYPGPRREIEGREATPLRTKSILAYAAPHCQAARELPNEQVPRRRGRRSGGGVRKQTWGGWHMCPPRCGGGHGPEACGCARGRLPTRAEDPQSCLALEAGSVQSLSGGMGRGRLHTAHAHTPLCMTRGGGPIGRVGGAVDTYILPAAPRCRGVQPKVPSSSGGRPQPTSATALPEVRERAVRQPAPLLEKTAWRGRVRWQRPKFRVAMPRCLHHITFRAGLF